MPVPLVRLLIVGFSAKIFNSPPPAAVKFIADEPPAVMKFVPFASKVPSLSEILNCPPFFKSKSELTVISNAMGSSIPPFNIVTPPATVQSELACIVWEFWIWKLSFGFVKSLLP